jgi:hypothetical protein
MSAGGRPRRSRRLAEEGELLLGSLGHQPGARDEGAEEEAEHVPDRHADEALSRRLLNLGECDGSAL